MGINMDIKKEVIVNKCFFVGLVGVIMIEILVIALQWNFNGLLDSSDDYRNDLNISEVITSGYPEIICQEADTYNYMIYKANEYRFLPDIYDKTNFLLTGIDVNGTYIGSSFSTSRCVVNDTLKLLKAR